MKVKELKDLLNRYDENMEICTDIENGQAFKVNTVLKVKNCIVLGHKPSSHLWDLDYVDVHGQTEITVVKW